MVHGKYEIRLACPIRLLYHKLTSHMQPPVWCFSWGPIPIHLSVVKRRPGPPEKGKKKWAEGKGKIEILRWNHFYHLKHIFIFYCNDSIGPDNIGGLDRVEALASYLVSLVPADNTGISLTNDQATKIISLWNQLDQYDKRPTKFSPHHRTEASGRFKAPKKR